LDEIDAMVKNSTKMMRLFGDWLARLLKLSPEKQSAFIADIAEAANNRLKVLESAKD
jgi:hypothetical protein